jgi:hypothetical protein
MTPVRALALLEESERHGGHPCSRHIGLSNDDLMRRLYNGEGAQDGGIQYISTFQTRMDAARAASQAFKNMPVSIAEALRSSERTRQIRIDETINVRFALGGGAKWLPANHVALILFANEEQKKQGLFYIKTFYPLPPNMLRITPLEGNVDGELRFGPGGG